MNQRSGFTFQRRKKAKPVLNLLNTGFTLVELIVVVAIIAILTAIAAVVYTGINQRSRDAARLADLAQLNQAVYLAVHDADNYAPILCFNQSTPCSGSSYPTSANTQQTDGTGWIPINFDINNIVTPNTLPLDPKNDSTYYYTYCSDGVNWKISAVLEFPGNLGMMQTDGGTNPNRYEVGSRLKQLSC